MKYIRKHDVKLLERLDRTEVLFDCYLLEKDLETLIDTELDADVNQKQAGLAHGQEQIWFDVFSAAADFPDGALGQPAVVHARDELLPSAALSSPTMESRHPEKGRRARVPPMKVNHLFDDFFRLADANHFAGGGAVEGVD